MSRIGIAAVVLAMSLAAQAQTAPADQENTSPQPAGKNGASKPMSFAAEPKTAAAGQENAKPQPAAKNSAPKQGSLDQVLHSMDENAAKFRSAQADFTWTPYNAVIGDNESPDKGRIYFRREGNEIQMAAMIQPPDDRQIIFTGGKVQVFQPKTKVVDVWDTTSHKDEAETFLVLGFGSSGQELRKSFDVKYIGDEKIGNVQTAKLELRPLSEKIKKTFPEIDLWVDPQRGISLRQKLLQTGGDYRLSDYSNVRLNEKVPDSAFKIKSSGATKTVTH